jgi:hypothetical protein
MNDTLSPTVSDAVPQEIVDKAGFARRWSVSTRTVENWLRLGLPHMKLGSRRVRIVIREADAWLREQFYTQRTAA